MKSYNYEQRNPSTSWVISHELAAKVLNSDVLINDGGVLTKILPGSVVHTNDNTTTITFSIPVTGRARLLTV